MRLAVLADVHANLAGLEAVIADARGRGVETFLCLGDVVGYHTSVAGTIELLQRLDIRCVLGNHDLMATGQLELEGGPNARRAMEWTRQVLTPEESGFLRELPGSRLLDGETLLVHSRLGDPVTHLRTDEQYREARLEIAKEFPEVRVCLTGHTHVGMVVEVDGANGVHRRGRAARDLRLDSFYFLNPGSVGHPRDEDYRASYLLYDPEARRVIFRKLAYDRGAVRAENERHGIHTDLGACVLAHRWTTLERSLRAVVRGALLPPR